MVGKRETPLERAVGDPSVDEVVALLVRLVGLAAGDEQHVLLRRDVDLVGLESGDRELDAIIVLALLDEVERRIVFLGLPEVRILEHVEQPVETDGRTPERRKVKSTTHNHVLQCERLAGRTRACREHGRPVADPNGVRTEESGMAVSGFKTCGKQPPAPLAGCESAPYVEPKCPTCFRLPLPPPPTITTHPRSRSSKASSPSAAAPACTSAGPTPALFTTSPPRSSTIAWTRRWPASRTASRSSSTPAIA